MWRSVGARRKAGGGGGADDDTREGMAGWVAKAKLAAQSRNRGSTTSTTPPSIENVIGLDSDRHRRRRERLASEGPSLRRGSRRWAEMLSLNKFFLAAELVLEESWYLRAIGAPVLIPRYRSGGPDQRSRPKKRPARNPHRHLGHVATCAGLTAREIRAFGSFAGPNAFRGVATEIGAHASDDG